MSHLLITTTYLKTTKAKIWSLGTLGIKVIITLRITCEFIGDKYKEHKLGLQYVIVGVGGIDD
jgi:hypothetical protein